MEINRNILPINTCVPWKPVATKKILPYAPSLKQKNLSLYSRFCNNLKYIPSKIVIESLRIKSQYFISKIA